MYTVSEGVKLDQPIRGRVMNTSCPTIPLCRQASCRRRRSSSLCFVCVRVLCVSHDSLRLSPLSPKLGRTRVRLSRSLEWTSASVHPNIQNADTSASRRVYVFDGAYMNRERIYAYKRASRTDVHASCAIYTTFTLPTLSCKRPPSKCVVHA